MAAHTPPGICSAAILLLAALTTAPLRAQALDLIGEKGVARQVSSAELASLPQAEIVTTAKDSSRIVLRGPTLSSVLGLVGAPSGHDLRGPNLLLVVVAEAGDGYKVAYSLAELDQASSGNTVILALTQNGGPLPAAEAPFRIAMSGGGEHRARWPRQVVRLRLLRVGT